jgi:putative NIF3 family GTP cyclohydrolase 1 type 2
VVTGVSANATLSSRAREEGAELVLVHHGLPRRRPLRDETFGVRALASAPSLHLAVRPHRPAL